MQDVTGTIGDFEIRGQLGRGAMAVVWRAYDPSLDRVVAIKEPVLPTGLETPAQVQFIERFLREGRAAAKLNHPGIVSVYSAAVYDGRPVIVMELITGPTLRTILRHGGLDTIQTYAMMDQLVAAVGSAHELGIVHRDLKPDNVFINPDGRVKLADFGIAQMDSSALTRIGDVLGTPAYMAPEQIRGHKTDARTDVFSLGVIAYEALAGRNPFGGSENTQITTVMHRIVNEPLPPIEVACPSVDPALAEVLLTALRKEPSDRYADATQMLTAWRNASPGTVDVFAVLAGLQTRRAAPTGPPEDQLTIMDGTPTMMEPADVPLEPAAYPAVALLAAQLVDGMSATGSSQPPAEATVTGLEAATPAPSVVPEPIVADATDSTPTVAAPTGSSASASRKKVLLVAAAIAVILIVGGTAFALNQSTEPEAVTVPVVRRVASTLKLSGPPTVVGKKKAKITAELMVGDNPVSGASLVLDRSNDGGKSWIVDRSVTTSNAIASVAFELGKTTLFRVRYLGNAASLPSTSSVVTVAYKAPKPKPRKAKKAKARPATRRRTYSSGSSSTPKAPVKKKTPVVVFPN